MKRKEKGLQDYTVGRIAVVDIGIPKRPPGVHVPADANGHDLPKLAKQIIQLRVRHIELQIPHIQRRRQQLPAGTSRRRRRGGGDGRRAPDRRHRTLWLHLHLRCHYQNPNPTSKIALTLKKQNFFFEFFSIDGFPLLLLLLQNKYPNDDNQIGR